MPLPKFESNTYVFDVINDEQNWSSAGAIARSCAFIVDRALRKVAMSIEGLADASKDQAKATESLSTNMGRIYHVLSASPRR